MILQKKHSKLATLLSIPVLATIYLYRPWGLFFLNDDLIHVPLSADAVFGQRNSIRIFNDFTLFLDAKIYGKNATGYHVTNLFYHAFASIALFFLVRKLQARQICPVSNSFLPLLSAILFFCYPFHSESIFWIIGRGSSVSVSFFTLSLIFFLKKEEHYLWALLALFPFGIALLTYESVWCFPIVLLLLSSHNISHGKSNFLQELGWTSLYTVTFVVFLIYRHYAVGEMLSPYETGNLAKHGWTILPKNTFRLLLRCIAPPMANNLTFIIMGSASVILFGSMLFVHFKKHRPHRLWLAGLVICWLASILPYITLGIDINGFESERYLYLPSALICIVIGTFICGIKKRFIAAIATFLALFYFFINLYIASSAYRKASFIVASTFSVLNQLPQKKFVIFKEMPSDYKGAVMLRLGFGEGWKWLGKNPWPDSFLVASRSSSRQLFKKVSIVRIKALSNYDLINPTLLSGDSLTGSFSFQNEKTVMIEYWENGIKVYE